MADRDDSRHRQASRHSGISVHRHRADIVGEEQPPLAGGPFQHHRIRCTCKADILDPLQVEIWPTTKQPADDVVIEVLVGSQRQHGLSPPASPSQQAIADAGRVMAHLQDPSDVGDPCFLLP